MQKEAIDNGKKNVIEKFINDTKNVMYAEYFDIFGVDDLDDKKYNAKQIFKIIISQNKSVIDKIYEQIVDYNKAKKDDNDDEYTEELLQELVRDITNIIVNIRRRSKNMKAIESNHHIYKHAHDNPSGIKYG